MEGKDLLIKFSGINGKRDFQEQGEKETSHEQQRTGGWETVILGGFGAWWSFFWNIFLFVLWKHHICTQYIMIIFIPWILPWIPPRSIFITLHLSIHFPLSLLISLSSSECRCSTGIPKCLSISNMSYITILVSYTVCL